MPAADEVTSECMASIMAAIGHCPARVTNAPPSGKSAAIINDQVANTRPNFLRPPSALVDANITKNPMTAQTVAGIRLKKKHISHHPSSQFIDMPGLTWRIFISPVLVLPSAFQESYRQPYGPVRYIFLPGHRYTEKCLNIPCGVEGHQCG